MRLRTPKAPTGEVKKDYVHMLNCTLSATERTLCCLLENYQTPDGVRYNLKHYMHSCACVPLSSAIEHTLCSLLKRYQILGGVSTYLSL